MNTVIIFEFHKIQEFLDKQSKQEHEPCSDVISKLYIECDSEPNTLNSDSFSHKYDINRSLILKGFVAKDVCNSVCWHVQTWS